MTVTSTAAGNLLVAGLLSSGNAVTISSVTAGACTSTWTHAPNTATSSAANGSADLYYCTNSASGQTSITITGSGTIGVGVIWEAHSTAGSIAIDSGSTPSSSNAPVSCTSCNGTSLTLSGNNDFIAALATCGQTCSGLTGTGWTNDLSNPTGDGVAHGITSGSQTAPATWTQAPSGGMNVNAAAFQEAGGAPTPKMIPVVY